MFLKFIMLVLASPLNATGVNGADGCFVFKNSDSYLMFLATKVLIISSCSKFKVISKDPKT